ncbi:SLATT domain-containing protein [Beggiatoa leptomitoformis]|uniref:SLATT domain-containing protein n=1 Tax=Beggiatoa leptomitoformis TaxID=288004 RepID=A0A2N9YBH1_9GAMM|nr:SLATT domain-containing protein [Beggiatoa leptomitoformis]AUI67830.1 SLATT domain-containing protein [Beggiatoa leptomitoformis]QGX03501.1 SLATT domain-containing protein [Beggiatoa leptomitoformis]
MDMTETHWKSIDELLQQWRSRAQMAQYSHFATANYLRKLHYFLGIPSIIFSTIVGTSVFASLNEDSTSTYLRLIVGVISVLAAGLSGMQTFLRFEERAERHHLGGTQYGAVAREIEQFLFFRSCSSDEAMKFLNKIRENMDRLAESSPEIPQDIWERNSARYLRKQQAELTKEPSAWQTLQALSAQLANKKEPESPPH